MAASTRKTTKSTTGSTAASSRSKAVAAAAPAEPKVVEDMTPSVTAPELKKAELIDMVVERSGMKKKDVKPVVEALMAVLGEQLGEGRMMNLQPFGKVKVTKIRAAGNGKVLTTRIRQSEATLKEQDAAPGTGSDTGPSGAKEALAEADD